MKILTKKEPMNKAIVVSLSLLTMLMIASCGKESSNEPPVPTITHKYEVISSGPIGLTISTIISPGEYVSVNGRDVNIIEDPTFNHNGSASYNISAKTRLLSSQLKFSSVWISSQDSTVIYNQDSTEITYKWTEYQNEKETKSDIQKLTLSPNDYHMWVEGYQTDLLTR